MIKGYKTVEEWREDFKRFQKASNDDNLLYHIKNRVNASPAEVQDKIIFELRNIGLSFGKDWDVLDEIKRDNPELTIVTNSREDVWFRI